MEASKSILTQTNVVTTIDTAFIEKVLKPYRSHATYLKKVNFQNEQEKNVQGLIAKGDFSIGESCYIDDTGHFNAVEYNICYNQLGYVFFGHCIKHKLIPELSDYTEETFLKDQLPNFLIIKINSAFTKMLNAKKFSGTWGITSMKKTSKCTFFHTYCDFYDDHGGTSKGEVTIGILPASTN